MNRDNEQLARRELEQTLRPQPFRQSVGEQLVNALLANDNFLPYGFVPSQALLRRANDGDLAKAYLDNAKVSASTAVHELMNFPARAAVACSHPLVRVLVASADGCAFADARRTPTRRAVDLVGVGGTWIHVRRWRATPGDVRDGVRRLLPHGGPSPWTLMERMDLEMQSATGGWPVLACVNNGPRDAADVGEVRFVDLRALTELSTATDGGRVVRAEVLENLGGDLWMTPEAFARRLAERVPAEAQPALHTFTKLLTTPVVDGRRVLECTGTGRLGVRPVRVHMGTGERITGFAPADFCAAVGGLFLRDDVRGVLTDALAAHRALTGLVGHNDAAPRLNLVVDPFVSAYRGIRRAHPAGYADVEQLLADVDGLPHVSGVPVVPPTMIHPTPPVVVNDVDWPDTGTWTAVNL